MLADTVNKNLKGRRAVIIGSSVSGMAAGISLASRGAKVMILEPGKTLIPDLAGSEFGACQFDPWPGFLISPNSFAELFAGAEYRLTDFVALKRRDILLRAILPEGGVLDLYNQPDKLAEEISKIDVKDGKQFERFLHKQKKLLTASEHLSSWQQGEGVFSLLHWQVLASAPSLLDPRNAAKRISSQFHHPEIKALFQSLLMVSGHSSFSKKAFANLQWAESLDRGGWFPEGGWEGLRQALLRLGKELGIRYFRKVSGIKVNFSGGRVRTVHVAGMKPISASIAVGACDQTTLARKYLEKKEIETHPYLAKTFEEEANSQGMMRIFATLIRRYDLLAPQTLVIPKSPKEESRFRERWTLPATIPYIGIQSFTGSEQDLIKKTTVGIHVPHPRQNERFRWDENHLEERENLVWKLLEKAGLTKIQERVGDKLVVVPQKSLPDGGARRSIWEKLALTTKKNIRRLAGSPRVPGLGGLYCVPPAPYQAKGPAAQCRAGMITAFCVGKDAE